LQTSSSSSDDEHHVHEKKPSSKVKPRKAHSPSPNSHGSDHKPRVREKKPSSRDTRDAQISEERSPILTASTGSHAFPETQPNSVHHLMGEAEKYCLPVNNEQSLTQQALTYNKPKKPPIRYDASPDDDFSLDRPYTKPSTYPKPSTDNASLSNNPSTSKLVDRANVSADEGVHATSDSKSSSKQKRFHDTYSASSIS